MRFRVFISGLLIAFAVGIAGAGLAQDKPPAQQQAPVDEQAKRAAQSLIENVLEASHAAEIFEDLRRTLRDVYIPVMRGMIQGDYAGAPETTAMDRATLAKTLVFMDYLRKAGDELDAALADYRSAMIADAAEQIARVANSSEVADLRRIVELPATQKTMTAFYALSRLVTGFSYDDSRAFSEFSAWASALSLDISQVMPGQGNSRPVPPAQKVLKAQALMDNLVRVSHLDEVAAKVKRFAREVLAEAAPLPLSDREKLREKIDQYEFLYTIQRAIVMGVAPAVVAASLTDDQLATCDVFIRSPAFVKASDLLLAAVGAATAYSKDDILEAQKAFEDLDKKTRMTDRSDAERDDVKAQWQTLIDKWTETLKNRISPETRRGLEQSLDDLQLRDPPI